MNLHRHIEVGEPAQQGAVAVPLDVVIQSKAKGVDFTHEMIRGMVAIGVPLGEVLRTSLGKQPLEDLIQLSGELAPSGVARMEALYELQKDIPDKAMFGQACLKAGFSPVGVALVALGQKTLPGSPSEGGHEESFLEAARLILEFEVDVWLANCLDGKRIRLDEAQLEKVSAPCMVVPCDLTVSNRRLAHTVTVPWLTEVGGALSVYATTNLQFPNLKAVGVKVSPVFNVNAFAIFIDARKSKGLEIPLLESTNERVLLEGATDFKLPKLKMVGGEKWV